MPHRHPGKTPNARIGKRVHFGPPGDVKKKGGSGMTGTIIDEVWVVDGGPRRSRWGRYCFFSQLIRWDSGRRTIRLGYYRKRAGEHHWEFGSQTTVNSTPATIRKLLRQTLAKDWFR
jgi:hypothetical protein